MSSHLRLFAGYGESDLARSENRPFVLSRLLEDGDSADLARLFSAVPEAEVAAWFVAHGGRQLSVRSRSFWQVLLATPAGPSSPDAPALWPL